jgi:hypothetical protein
MAGRRNTPTGRSAGAVAGQSTRRRKAFEAGDPARMATISDQQFSATKTFGEAGVSPKTAYRLQGYHELEPPTPHPHGQQELPGMTSVHTARASGLLSTSNTPAHQSRTLPDLAPAPRRWERMSAEEQNHTLAMARQFGATPESMHRSFGAQLDQSYARASGHNMTPYASHFYSGDDPSRQSTPEEMQPREVLKRSARGNNTDFSTQVMANAITSPKAKFRQVSAQTGEVHYPNDEAANVAIQGAQAGMKHVEKPPGMQVMQGNIDRATSAVRQRIEGRSLEDIRNPGGKNGPGGSPFGPKTGPYANSFLDPHGSSQFFVSDVHSGGAGMAPHIPHEAPFRRNESGEIDLSKGNRPVRTKSEREKYLEIPGIHALHDHVAQQVLHERGLHSLSGVQAAQWGEEQVSRAEVDRGARKVTLVSEGDAYRKQPMREEIGGQLDIFGGEAHRGSRAAVTRPRNVEEMPTGRDRVKAEAAASAIQRNVTAKRRRQGRIAMPTHKDLGNEPYEGWG